ncbi:MAG: hypothetical protein H8D54_01260 [Candidatus Omnitrophica bacterium]|nr:hypothetical protein [Candidatus Omnitrophota bacterium]
MKRKQNKAKKILVKIGSIFILVSVIFVAFYFYYYMKVYPITLIEEKYSPREWVKSKEGDITIYGWRVEKIWDKPHTYIVSYRYATSQDRERSESRGWAWEINTKERLTKYITADDELEKRYGLSRDYIEELERPRFDRKTFYEFKKEHIEESKAQWRKLKKGLTEFQVRDILGEPKRVDAYSSSPSFIQWEYPKKGFVRFYRSGIFSDKYLRLDAWKEPASGTRKKWRRLQKSLTEVEVKEILGEPQRVDAFASSPPFIKWTYSNEGSIKFYSKGPFFKKSSQVEAWKEPHWQEI